MSITISVLWAEALNTFTQRNMSRRMDLQIISEDMGAQSEARAMPLRGVAYDRRDGGVEIMLGAAGTHHITHSIGDVRAVDMVTGDAGHRDILRVCYSGGAAILTASHD